MLKFREFLLEAIASKALVSPKFTFGNNREKFNFQIITGVYVSKDSPVMARANELLRPEYTLYAVEDLKERDAVHAFLSSLNSGTITFQDKNGNVIEKTDLELQNDYDSKRERDSPDIYSVWTDTNVKRLVDMTKTRKETGTQSASDLVQANYANLKNNMGSHNVIRGAILEYLTTHTLKNMDNIFGNLSGRYGQKKEYKITNDAAAVASNGYTIRGHKAENTNDIKTIEDAAYFLVCRSVKNENGDGYRWRLFYELKTKKEYDELCEEYNNTTSTPIYTLTKILLTSPENAKFATYYFKSNTDYKDNKSFPVYSFDKIIDMYDSIINSNKKQKNKLEIINQFKILSLTDKQIQQEILNNYFTGTIYGTIKTARKAYKQELSDISKKIKDIVITNTIKTDAKGYVVGPTTNDSKDIIQYPQAMERCPFPKFLLDKMTVQDVFDTFRKLSSGNYKVKFYGNYEVIFNYSLKSKASLFPFSTEPNVTETEKQIGNKCWLILCFLSEASLKSDDYFKEKTESTPGLMVLCKNILRDITAYVNANAKNYPEERKEEFINNGDILLPTAVSHQESWETSVIISLILERVAFLVKQNADDDIKKLLGIIQLYTTGDNTWKFTGEELSKDLVKIKNEALLFINAIEKFLYSKEARVTIYLGKTKVTYVNKDRLSKKIQKMSDKN